MIASVSGEVVVRRADHVVVDTGGVGYHLAISAETLRSIPATGETTSLYAHLVSREDSLSLYGFATDEERELFLLLISVSGIGPKVAIAALSGGPVRELLLAIATGDAKRFQAVPGIGKRTADRIIVELREKVAGELAEVGAESEVPSPDAGGPRAEARDGLLGLGYTPVEAERLLDRVDGESAEQLLGAALRAGVGDRAAA